MSELRILMNHTDDPEQTHIDRYESNGGYQAIKKEIAPQTLIAMVQESGLRGRGGAGFPTGTKWKFVPTGSTSYLVCNADESEPGTFKDRLLIERDPHQLIEGIILASRAIQAHQAFIYCRGEFFKGMKQLTAAIEEAKLRGYLETIDIIVHPGAGAYIAGEETAQLNSLEGYRATPRLKPPFPAISGLYGRPTVINNVETLCNVVHIVNRGVDWYKTIGKPNSQGTKIFQVSGHVQKPGCYEFPLGVPLREVLETAGWMLPGRNFKACYPGGSSCSLLTAKDLDIAMDFDSLRTRGSALGTASIIVMDDSTDMVKVAHRLMQFYQNESCGKCTPCREGTRWTVQMLARLEAGLGTFADLEVIERVLSSMVEHSFCPLAMGAAPPIASALHAFKEEFIAMIERNPAALQRTPMKIVYPYL